VIHKVDIKTSSRVDFQDITRIVNGIVAKSGVKSGVCYIFVPHTTAGVMVNEHADPDVVKDITTQLDSIAPQHDGYRHREGNSPAHQGNAYRRFRNAVHRRGQAGAGNMAGGIFR
jgi:secondary thiamine-phosphate synthase enzyme